VIVLVEELEITGMCAVEEDPIPRMTAMEESATHVFGGIGVILGAEQVRIKIWKYSDVFLTYWEAGGRSGLH
jgi:hypothetical protein